MNAEVDISGRIEETNKPSALALTNGTSISICLYISARDKRHALEILKQRKPERRQTLHHLFIYSTLIFFALRDHHHALDQVTIDLEYAGHEADIRLYILKALGVFRGEKADRIVTAEDILREYPYKEK